MSRVLITGTGAVCGAGATPEAILSAAVEGRSAITPITLWDTTGWNVTRGAEIAGFNPRALVEDRKLHKLIRRTDMLGIYAGSRAVESAGIDAAQAALDDAAAAQFSDRTGCYVGSGGGAYANQYDFLPLLAESHGDMKAFGRDLGAMVNPMWLLRSLPNNVLCHVGIKYNLKGSNACITNHGISGTLAVIEAMEALRHGEADRAIAIGHDAPVEPQHVLYYDRCGLLAREAVRPFDAARDGTLFGEGAGALALETAASATARGATPIAEVLGGGATAEAQGLLAIRDDGDGPIRAMQAAFEDAGLAPGDVGMIVAHGTGTPQSDASEAAAIRRVFGDAIPPVTAFKWAYGHLLAAAGILDAVVAIAAMKARVVPGIATLRTPDPACAPLPVSRDAAKPRSDVVLLLGRGFAGTDSALLIRVL